MTVLGDRKCKCGDTVIMAVVEMSGLKPGHLQKQGQQQELAMYRDAKVF
jgi:hypothetical protein